jgi:SAM-dependent methyltransferase
MHQLLQSILVCPRCRGPLTFDRAAHCARCQIAFPIREDIPRMNDGAPERDAKMAAEWQAQSVAHHMYVDRASVVNLWEEQVLPHLVDWIGGLNGPLLDVGCGIGRLGRVLSEIGRDDVQLIGLDFQAELLREAGHGYVGLIEGDVHHLPVRDGAFAAAIASNSLHHFPDAAAAMREIARVLKPGGTFVAYDPRFVTPLEVIKKIVRRRDAAFTEDHKAFKVDEYRELLGSSGLRVRDVVTVDPIAPLVATGLDLLKVGRIGVAEAAAKALATADRVISRGWESRFGLMIAGRAVKPA